MKKVRKKFNSTFKAKVAVEALREQHSLAELSIKHGLHPTQITEWKKQLLSNSDQIFNKGNPIKAQVQQEKDMDELYKQIGQLKVENDWLKKKSEHLYFKK